MSILRRYSIKYKSDSLQDLTILNIQKIYNQVKLSFPDDENQNLVLTGSSALFIYIQALGYDDLLNKLEEISDVDLLIVLNSRKIKVKPYFNILYIGDYRRINKKSKKPDEITIKSKVTFKNIWTSDKINEFDLTYVFGIDIHYNQVNNFKLIKLEDLLLFYQSSLKIPEIKIEIIQEILERLKAKNNLGNLAKL
jgi:hypothetical protein